MVTGQHATREFDFDYNYLFLFFLNILITSISSRFSDDIENFKIEPSSVFCHRDSALSSYRESPFVTGCFMNFPSQNGLQTEIMDHAAGQWNQVADYPFTGGGNGDR